MSWRRTGILSAPLVLSTRVMIRDARPAELTVAGQLRVAAYQAGGHLSPSSQYAATLAALGTADDGQVLVAVQDDQILGTIMLQPWPHAGEVVTEPEEAEIRALAVATDGQGKGIGRALLQAVIGRAVRDGIARLVLLTQPDMLAAQNLYQHAGFRRLPERDWSPAPGVTLLAYGLDLPRSTTR
jgi:ribosomal protein S18 acetylase RimI-like enzyme